MILWMPLQLTIPQKPYRLQLTSLRGVEQLSSPFRYELYIISQTEICWEALQNKPIQVSLGAEGQSKRCIYGVLQSLQRLEQDVDGAWSYQGVLVPSVLRLERHVDCRIFKRRSVVEIVKQIFAEHRYDQCEWRLSKSYFPLDYCVQYHENSFSFVARLLAHAGIHYYFQHKHECDTLVLLDDPAYLLPHSQQWQPHAWKKTISALSNQSVTQTDWAMSRDYRISAGSLLSHQNRSYLVMRVFHQAYRHAHKYSYLNQVKLAHQPIPALPNTPTCAHPIAHGVEFATVIGSPHERVHTDTLARIQCRFDWDNRDSGQNSSWLPTMQWAAGFNRGSVFLPAVSQKIGIVYQHANPDQPIMIGGFYAPSSNLRVSHLDTVSSNTLSFNNQPDYACLHLSAAKDLQVEVSDRFIMQVGANVTLRLQKGHSTHKITAGKALLKAHELHLKSGSYSLQVGRQGVQFQGPNVIFITSDAANAYELQQRGVQNIRIGS